MKKLNLSLAVIALLSNTQAVSLSYRPPSGSTPWHVENFSENVEIQPNFPHGYEVNDFGADPDIENTQRNIAEAEKELNVVM